MIVRNIKAKNIMKNYFNRSLKCAEFAVTNACIAQCSFCDIWKQKPKVFTDKKKTLQAISRLAEFGVSHITFTGGEPLLHTGIIDFVELAAKNRIHNAVLVAAPQLLMRNNMIQRLEYAGCDVISVSFDSGDPKTMAESRKIDNIMDDMKRAMEMLKPTKLKTMASVLIWSNNCDQLEEVCINAQNMGFDFISFNYPTFSESNVYQLGGEGVDFPREKLISALETAITLKKSGKYNIINSAISMKNIIDYLKEPSSARFKCLGGTRVMFIDWFFDVHPCMQLPQTLGSILTMEESDFSIPACNACNMSWYRDLSLYFYGVRSIPVLYESLSKSRQFINR